tara:strand:- start:935 stop:1090 length:156 start_codon:yes stop_codon:yes gene_type:complete
MGLSHSKSNHWNGIAQRNLMLNLMSRKPINLSSKTFPFGEGMDGALFTNYA